MKKRLYTLSIEQLDELQCNESGDYIIPDNMELYIVPTAEDLRAQRVVELEAQLSTMVEPTEEELIQAGKMMHPYYMMLEELTILKSE